MVTMDTLPPFSGDDTRCAKCGNDEASTSYTPPNHLCACRIPTGIGERLCRVCLRCDFHWDEAIAENDDPGRAPDCDVAAAARSLYRLWYWDADWRNGTTPRGREQVLHELYCAAAFGQTPRRDISQQMDSDAEWVIPVVVPHAAFELLVELAEYARSGGEVTPTGQRAIDALAAAGLIPAKVSA